MDKSTFPEQIGQAAHIGSIIIDFFSTMTTISLHQPRQAKVVAQTIWQWRRDYFTTQKNVRQQPRYLLYTEADMAIPFKPEATEDYAGLIPTLSDFIRELVLHHKPGLLERTAATIATATKTAVDVFETFPTTVPRFEHHERFDLRLAQYLDDPVNCCPSLHVGLSAIMYNIGKHFFRQDSKAITEKTLEQTITSVLYTKQHSLADVAFGLLGAQRAFETYFSQEFMDPIPIMKELQTQYHDVPMEQISEIYSWGREQHAQHLTTTVGKFLCEGNYPLLPPERDTTILYFDTQTSQLGRNNNLY